MSGCGLAEAQAWEAVHGCPPCGCPASARRGPHRGPAGLRAAGWPAPECTCGDGVVHGAAVGVALADLYAPGVATVAAVLAAVYTALAAGRWVRRRTRGG